MPAATPVPQSMPAAPAATGRRAVVTDGDSDEDVTLEVLAAEGDGPPSPTVKIEPAEQLAGWAPLGDLAIEIEGVQVPLPDGTPVVDLTADGGSEAVVAAADGGRRGGRGVPKTCRTCGALKKGGCACVKNNDKGV